MKNLNKLLMVVSLVTTTLNVLSQTTYPFEVKTSGKGKRSIIFIPGFGCSGHVWDDTKANYENDFVCYTLTMAGFAGVPAQPNATFQNWEKGIAMFIKENKIVEPIIIGHSMGGGLAMAVASDYPDIASKIILIDALPALPALFDPTFKSKSNSDCSDLVSQLNSISKDQFYQMQKAGLSRMLEDTSKMERIVEWTTKSDRTTFAEMYCDFTNTDLREKIAAVKCPALILLEAPFAAFKPAINDQFKNLKTANLKYATKGLHFVMYDDKEWYDQQISEFIGKRP